MKVLNLSGGVTCTIQADHMQRAPVFVFDSAREARAFCGWVDDHLEDLRREAEATTRVGKLQQIEQYLASKFAYLRFDFTTGDAAGQNLVGRATFAACSWILEHHPAVRRFYLESNLATDKKASQVNLMRTRGKARHRRVRREARGAARRDAGRPGEPGTPEKDLYLSITSLAAAISSLEWVSAHEAYGRNR